MWSKYSGSRREGEVQKEEIAGEECIKLYEVLTIHMSR